MPYLCTRFCAEVRLSAAKHRVLVNAPSQKSHREVAQLVAHHVRDVGVGRSSRLFSTTNSFQARRFSRRALLLATICHCTRTFPTDAFAPINCFLASSFELH